MAIALVSAGVAAADIGGPKDDDDIGGDAGFTKALRAQKIQLNRDKSEPAYVYIYSYTNYFFFIYCCCCCIFYINSDVYSWFEITLKAIDVPSQTFECSIEVHLFWQDFNVPNIFPDFATQDFEIDDDDVPVKMSEIFENKLSCDLEGDPQFQYYQETGMSYDSNILYCSIFGILCDFAYFWWEKKRFFVLRTISCCHVSKNTIAPLL